MLICSSIHLPAHPVHPSFLPCIHPSSHPSFPTTHSSTSYADPLFTAHLPGTSFHLQTHSTSLRGCQLIHPSHYPIIPSIHASILPSTYPSYTFTYCSLSTYQILAPTFKPTNFLRCGAYSSLPVGRGLWALPATWPAPCRVASHPSS